MIVEAVRPAAVAKDRHLSAHDRFADQIAGPIEQPGDQDLVFHGFSSIFSSRLNALRCFFQNRRLAQRKCFHHSGDLTVMPFFTVVILLDRQAIIRLRCPSSPRSPP